MDTYGRMSATRKNLDATKVVSYMLQCQYYNGIQVKFILIRDNFVLNLVTVISLLIGSIIYI